MDCCKGCGLCVASCPTSSLELGNKWNRLGYHPVEFRDPQGQCTGCALCAVICPDVCITVYRFQKPVIRRSDPMALA